MAYGNLPGGGFSGFVKAKQPLTVKRRSYLPIAEWPDEYKEYLEEISSQESEIEPENVDEEGLDLRKRGKDKASHSLLKEKKTPETVDERLETENGIDEDSWLQRIKKFLKEKLRKEDYKKPEETRLKSKDKKESFEDYPSDIPKIVSTKISGDKHEKISKELKTKVPSDKSSDVAEQELKLETGIDDDIDFLDIRRSPKGRKRRGDGKRLEKAILESKEKRESSEEYPREYSKTVRTKKSKDTLEKFEREPKTKVSSDEPPHSAEKERQEFETEIGIGKATDFQHLKRLSKIKTVKGDDKRPEQARLKSKEKKASYEDSKIVSTEKSKDKLEKPKVVPIYKPSDIDKKELKLEDDIDEETDFLTSKRRSVERGRKEDDTRPEKPRLSSKRERARYEDYPRDSKTVSSKKAEDKIEKFDKDLKTIVPKDKSSDAAGKEDQFKLKAAIDEETDFLSVKRRSKGKRRKEDDKIAEKTRLEIRQKKSFEDYPTDYSKVVSTKRDKDKKETFDKELKTKEPSDKFFGIAEKEHRELELETGIDEETDFFTVKRQSTRRGRKEDDKKLVKDGLKIKETKMPIDETLGVDKEDERKDDRVERVPRVVSKRKTKKSSKDYTKSILKKGDGRKKKVGKGRMKTVTFDDENLIDYSEAESTEESEMTKDEVAIEMGDDQDASVFPGEDDAIPAVSDELEMPEFRIKFRRPRRNPTYTYFKRKRSIFRFSPCIDRLMYSQRMEYRGLKAMLGFPIGALFGFALYWIVLERLKAEHYFCWFLGICIGTGFALSTQVRCICFLSIPACCGRAGRAFVSTYLIAYVIEGPLLNIMTNAKESMRVISCTASLNLNHTVERFKLMFQPVKDIVVDFMGAGKKVQDDTKQLETAFTDIENEVRDEDEMRESMSDTEALDNEVGGESRVDIIKSKFSTLDKKAQKFGVTSEKKYGMKSEFRCEGVFNKGVRGCYKSFGMAYDKCHSYLPIIGYLLCWPMKLTFICDLASSLMGKRACDTVDVLNPGFGASVDTADGVQSEFEKDFAVQLQYKLTIPEESVDQLSPEDVSGAMKYSFERRKKNLEFAAHLMDRMLALLVLLVILSSRKYCNQYLRAIQFDNKYVTSYFRHIDARRKKKGKMILLPLKKGEQLELSSPFSVKFTPDEKIILIINGVRLVSEVLTVSILLMFDRIFYEFLDLIKRHAHVTYKQTGAHHIKMTIYGNGFVANMVRGILKGFDKKQSLDQVTTTEECLPLPTKLPQEKIIRLYFVFLLLMILIILESYSLRLRRVICSFFYPKREKRRIIFLYNDRLKKRRSYLQHMRHTVRKQAREQAIAIDSGVFFSLRKFYPKYFSWLSKFGLGLSQCLICREKESGKCRLVDCSECPFSYCSDCWQDTEEKCYVCLPDDDTEPSEDALSDE